MPLTTGSARAADRVVHDSLRARFSRTLLLQPALWVRGYVLAFLVAEVAGLTLGPTVASALYAVICFALVNHHLALVLDWDRGAGARTIMTRPPAMLLLATVACSRLAALSTVLLDPAWYGGYAIAAIPLCAGLLYFYLNRQGLHLHDWPPRGRFDRRQVAIAAMGAPLGVLAFATGLARPELDWWDMGWAIYVGVPLFALSGAAEELLYRGLLQPLLGRLLGSTGVVATTLIYTVTHADIDAGMLVTLVVANIVFGQLMRRTGSLVGVCAGHALLNVVVGLAMPYWWPH